MEKLIDHWQYGYGATYNPVRGEALSRVRMRQDVDEMIGEIRSESLGEPIIIGTSSKERPDKAIGYEEVRELGREGVRPVHILFGTGWGLTDEVVDRCERMLIPIKGEGDYNHLSLRVALGITLDRIFGGNSRRMA